MNLLGLVDKVKTLTKRFSYSSDDPDWDGFYQRFEDRFRGSEEMISERLANRYSDRLRQIIEQSKSFNNGRFIDLGCGRGELLDIAKRTGYKTVGVELSPVAGRISRKRGHEVYFEDILQFLKRQEPESAVAVSCFHVVEHNDAKYNWQVFKNTYQLLKPGGVFIVETPSLFSLWAGHRQFYLDPTHEKPIHPDLLRFMAEDSGFSTVELLEFDEVEGCGRANLSSVSNGKMGQEFKNLEKWLYGPMDMTLWAVK